MSLSRAALYEAKSRARSSAVSPVLVVYPQYATTADTKCTK